MRDIEPSDLIENPTPRVPVCLCLDVSPSMSGDPRLGADPNIKGVPIDELNLGVQLLYTEIQQDEIAKYAAEVAVVTFSGDARLVRDFATIASNPVPPRVELDLVKGGTSLGAGVQLALDLLERRKQQYKATATEYYQPWLVIITDGRPTDDTHLVVAPRVVQMVNEGKLVVFPIGVGGLADLSALRVLSPKREPAQLAGIKFREFFEWIAKSVSRVSKSKVGDEVHLPPPTSWMKL